MVLEIFVYAQVYHLTSRHFSFSRLSRQSSWQRQGAQRKSKCFLWITSNNVGVNAPFSHRTKSQCYAYCIQIAFKIPVRAL